VAGKVCMLSTFYNITERKKAAEEIKNTHLLLKSGIESQKNMIILAIDNDYNYLFFNGVHKDAMMHAYGKEVEVGMNLLDCITSEIDKVNSRINYGRALNGESYSTIQEYGDKERGYYETFYNPIINENNEIIGTTAFARDITERKNTENEIIYISFHDKLTGLYNRRFFEEEILRLNTKRQMPLSVVMIDLNSLKLINDTFGHNEGDKILKGTAALLKKICRSDDILARWGGDEFVILLPKTSITDLEEIAQRIKKECSKLTIQKIPLSLAIGVATKTEAKQDMQSILIDAENNMYKNKLIEKESSASSIISALEQALYEKSNETMEHAFRLKDSAIKLGKSIKLASSQLDELSLLASLHDIGKVSIPEKILLKEGKLTEKEWEVIKRHPEIGFNIARSSPQIVHIAKFILACHENWDGSGYPQGLTGESIPIVSRIMLICDAYDVMTSKRLYKKTMSKEASLKELKRCSGTQFDPVLVDKFIEILSN
jgi:diguanylate cyclase (GGDEF)-like protein/PAS domain S-box-containing protein